MGPWASVEGFAFPFGVFWVEPEQAYKFVLYSKHAHPVALLPFGERECRTPIVTRALDYLVNKSGRIWHCYPPRRWSIARATTRIIASL